MLLNFQKSQKSVGIILLLSLWGLSGCSWITGKRTLFGDDKEDKEKNSKTVSREQYEQLLRKYRNLKVENEKFQAGAVQEKMDQDPPSAQSLMNQTSQEENSSELQQTVDIFSKSQKSTPRIDYDGQGSYDDAQVEREVSILNKSIRLVEQNKFDQALKELKEIENSNIRQINVRAKFWLGELLFRQNEYDLAMQIFEEILKKDAFSGVVIKSLGRLIVCTEKLKLEQKRARFYSLLHDIFQSAG
jgi:TolA-binding protein